jgi:hypothetical protein
VERPPERRTKRVDGSFAAVRDRQLVDCHPSTPKAPS